MVFDEAASNSHRLSREVVVARWQSHELGVGKGGEIVRQPVAEPDHTFNMAQVTDRPAAPEGEPVQVFAAPTSGTLSERGCHSDDSGQLEKEARYQIMALAPPLPVP